MSKQDGDGFTGFIYQGPDMLKLVLERDDQGQTRAHYTMGNGLEAMRRDSTSSFYHYDALGSTFELTDAVEDVTDTWLYNAWGEVLERTGSTVNRHTYVGKERYYVTPDPESYLLGVRYYAAAIGRLLTVDPLARQALQGSTYERARGVRNPYGYCSSVPSSRTDPLGLWDKDHVHRDMTILWGSQVTAFRSGSYWGPTAGELSIMGGASRYVDILYDPTDWTKFRVNWPWHVDWLPGGSDSRVVKLKHCFAAAIALGQSRSRCPSSAAFLGLGLHPLQDYFSPRANPAT